MMESLSEHPANLHQTSKLRLSTDRISFCHLRIFGVILGCPDVHDLFRQQVVGFPNSGADLQLMGYISGRFPGLSYAVFNDLFKLPITRSI